MIDHGALTDLMLVQLRATGELVGDGVAPIEGGWLAGQPNNDVFVPYMVLVDGGGMLPNPVLVSVRPDWNFTWSFRYFGGSRKQCDWVGTTFRDRVPMLLRQEFGDDPHRIVSAETRVMGAVTRNDQVDPPYWQALDTVNLICSPKSVMRQ